MPKPLGSSICRKIEEAAMEGVYGPDWSTHSRPYDMSAAIDTAVAEHGRDAVFNPLRISLGLQPLPDQEVSNQLRLVNEKIRKIRETK